MDNKKKNLPGEYNGRAERHGNNIDRKRRTLTYEQLATHRKGKHKLTDLERTLLEQERNDYKRRFTTASDVRTGQHR